MNKSALQAWVLLWMGLIGVSQAFMPTRLNYSDPDIEEMLCPSQMTGVTYDLKEITRESLRREVRLLFLDDPPTNDTFYLPEDATLVELFRLYYGDNASPVRFYKAVNDIAWANALTDSAENSKYDPKYHFEAEKFSHAQQLLALRYNSMVNSIQKKQEYAYAREMLGTTLHAIQDFYAYSNWVELGNTEPLPELGLPGCDYGNVATPDDAVCTDCSSSDGGCKNNVIQNGLLTSGYYTYDSEDGSSFIVSKPEDAGKCSHGGSLDTSSTLPAVGGINKATTSPCYSPHHHLHQDAVELAIASSQSFLGALRSVIGNEEFKKLLDLYRGAALSIVIDVTDSMSLEINQVKQQTHEIVEKSKPELLILVPYNDPYEPNTETITSDPDVFLSAVDSLKPNKACCCQQEPVWTALEVAVSNTPEYSNIYLFTDAGGNDAEKMEAVMATAEDKHLRITIIYSSETYKTDPPCLSPTSNETDYRNLASQTGGQFVEIDKVDIDSIIDIIDGGAEEAKVYIRIRNEITGTKTTTFPVDDTLQSVEVMITGPTTSASLLSADGTTYDLMDQAALEAAGVQVKVFSESLKKVEFILPRQGQWELQTNSDASYDIFVTAVSTLDFLSEMTMMDITPPRPNYHLIEGQPIVGYVYYVEIMLVGWIESLVLDVTDMKFVDKHGDLLSYIEHKDKYVDNEIYIESTPLPNQNFYIMVNGHLSSGKEFSRIYPVQMIPVDLSLNVDLATSDLEGPPGSTKYAYFTVTNLGPNDHFTFACVDELEFVHGVLPSEKQLDKNANQEVKVTFVVPKDAQPYDVSRFTFTAANSVASSSALNNFLVLPNDIDYIAPTCTTDDEPDCSDYNSETCGDGHWTIHAQLQDENTGLYQVTADPEEGLIVNGFTNGTTDVVHVDYTTSCCVTEVTITGVDGQGNVGRCVFDLGDLSSGFIIEFIVIDVGTTWVKVQWTIQAIREDLTKYTLETNGFIDIDIQCNDLVCTHTVENLQPCHLQHFTLVPHFRGEGGEDKLGSESTTEATTLEGTPEPPTNLQTVSVTETGITVSWDPPANIDCVQGYQVCYYMIGSPDDVTCHTTDDTLYILDEIEACVIYYIDIQTMSNSGLVSDPIQLNTNSMDAVPGKPRNLEIANTTEDGVVCLSWDAPDKHRFCAKSYTVTYIKNEEVKSLIVPVVVTGEFSSCMNSIAGCANYTFAVSTLSHNLETGGTSYVTESTPETEPTAIDSVSTSAITTSSMVAAWTLAGAESCVDHYRVCATAYSSFQTECVEIYDITYEFNNLVACETYEVTVNAISPSGHHGQSAVDFADTQDDAPGAPESLEILDKTPYSIHVSFDQPLENPVCAYEYDIGVKPDRDYIKHNPVIKKRPNLRLLTVDVENLTPCVLYNVTVNFKSKTGLEGPASMIQSVTEVIQPTVPMMLEQLDVTDTTVVIKWFGPQEGRQCIEKYIVSWEGTNGDSGSTEHPNDRLEIETTLSPLTPCTDYNISVVGVTHGDQYTTDPALLAIKTTC